MLYSLWCRNPRRMPMRTLGVSQPLTVVVLAVVFAVALLPFRAADARHYSRHGRAAEECGPAQYGTEGCPYPQLACKPGWTSYSEPGGGVEVGPAGCCPPGTTPGWVQHSGTQGDNKLHIHCMNTGSPSSGS